MGAGVDPVVRLCRAVEWPGQADRDDQRALAGRCGEVGGGLLLGLGGKSSLPSSRIVMLSKSIGQNGKPGRSSRVA